MIIFMTSTATSTVPTATFTFTNPSISNLHHHHHHHHHSPLSGDHPPDHSGHGHHHVMGNSTLSTNLFFTTINLINDVISVGVISSPYYFSQGGIWITTAAFIFFGILNTYTLGLIYKLSHENGFHNFAEMCHSSLGRAGFIMSCMVIFLLNWGALVAGMQVIGMSAPVLMRDWFGDHVALRRTNLLVMTTFIFGPVSYFKSVARLSIPSLLNQFFLYLAFLLVIVKVFEAAADGVQDSGTEALHSAKPLGVLSAVGGVSYLFVCHDFGMNILRVLEDPTPRRWLIVSACTTGGLILVSGLVGICGLLFVGPGDNLLEAFHSHAPLINVARLSISLAACSGIAYNVFMPRVAITAVIQLFAPTWTVKLPGVPGNRFRRNVVHVTITTLLLASALIISIFFDKLGLTYEIIGAVAGISIGLIFPPLCVIVTSKAGVFHNRTNILSFITLIIGVCSMIGCVTSLLLP
eukprot:m.114671 g.114671  ORF g.114671 m.114671 type:complete len:465 (-) comp16036_c1_seq1:1340-2734(-)